MSSVDVITRRSLDSDVHDLILQKGIKDGLLLLFGGDGTIRVNKTGNEVVYQPLTTTGVGSLSMTQTDWG